MIFFNCSLPRCGSELLQQILHQNPDIYASRTDGVLELLYAARKNFSELPEFRAQDQPLMERAFSAFCASGLTSWATALSGGRRHVCLKSRGITHWYEWFVEFTRSKPKVIVMVRDLRSILSSMEKQYRKHRSLHPDVDRPAVMQGITVDARVGEWMGSQPVGLALQRLLGVFERKLEKNFLFIRFEDLVADPAGTMSEVYTYLELPEYEHNFSKLPELDFEQENAYGPFGAHSLRGAVEPMKPDYNEILGRELSSQIVANNRWFYSEFFPEKT